MSANDSPERTGPRRGLVGRVIGERYRVTRVVSAGTDTVIVDADDDELHRPVTVKLVRPEWAESPEFRQRFARAMKVMAKLSHPNLAAVYDWGEEDIGKRTTVYAVVETLSGGSLRDLLDRGRLLEPSQALLVGLEACRGLDFAHHKGLVHTELTPAKLVFGDDRRLRITDFALARLLGAQDWSEPATVATHVARYASPEQALAQPVDGKSDVYSLALILVEAVTGTVPFAARSTVATLSARVGRLMPVSADLGPLASVLERAGRPEPEERSTAAEFGRALVRSAEKLPRPAPIPLIVTSVFEDEKLRRPNDPTGGVHRPEDSPTALAAAATAAAATAAAAAAATAAGATAATAAATPAPAVGPEAPDVADVPGDEVEPPPEPEPAAEEEPADIEASEPVEAEEEVAAPVELPPPDPETLIEDVASDEADPDSSPHAELYDGDVDATIDELAALARAPEPDDAPVGPVLPPPVAAPAERGERGRRRWLTAVVALLVLAALAGLAYLAYRLFRTPTHEVPALVGLTEADATRLTDGFDWEIEVQLDRSDEEPDQGDIIRTAPVAGEQLAEGEPFLIVVSEGPEFRALPDVAGLPLSDAETALAELRLVALPATEQFDEVAPVNQVLSWSVPADPSLAAGDDVLPDTEVALVVSAGPAARVIPELVGLPVADARAQLEAMQLVVVVAEPQFHDTVPIDGVVSVDPPATSNIERGSTVTIVPSKGVDLVVMPDLTGMLLPQAQATLNAAGLNVGSLLGVTTGTFVSASVAGEDAAPGSQYRRGTAIDLVLL